MREAEGTACRKAPRLGSDRQQEEGCLVSKGQEQGAQAVGRVGPGGLGQPPAVLGGRGIRLVCGRFFRAQWQSYLLFKVSQENTDFLYLLFSLGFAVLSSRGHIKGESLLHLSGETGTWTRDISSSLVHSAPHWRAITFIYVLFEALVECQLL